MRRRLSTLTLAIGAVISSGVGAANAQGSVSVEAAENGRLWFVELAGKPMADGNTLAAVRAEKQAFRQAAAAAGVRYLERRSYDTLFNGFSIEIAPADRMRIAQLLGVKAIYPVEKIAAPQVEGAKGVAADMASALAMTGASLAQNNLGLTGKGVRVGIIDTGIDIDHPAFGGAGTNGATAFPSARVVAGYDFVGDEYNAAGSGAQLVPRPDDNPDDCGGHGTHVAGIVGGNGGTLADGSTLKGVAPEVSFGAYRVFGCEGSTSSDIILSAMERALADGMQVVNQSLGSARQWPQYPTAQASTRLVNKGVVMVASIGNNGPGSGTPDAQFAAGAPGVGDKVIGVASFDNTLMTLPAFTVSPGGNLIGFNSATGAPPVPTSGSLPMVRTGTTASTADGCTALPAGSLAGTAALIRRGTCSFFIKASNAQAAGAAAVVLYDNAPGLINPTVAGTPPITIPVVAISAANGAILDGLIQAGPTTLTWGNQIAKAPVSTGGLISGFSSYGLAADLGLKPNIGAPGGFIYSSYPLEKGAFATLSGTSMSSPHVAGAVALLLEADPKVPSNAVMSRLQSSASPKNWSGNPGLGFLEYVHRQGAGMLDIVGSIQATTTVEPSQLSLGESEAGPATRTITVHNKGPAPVTYALSHAAALSSGPNSGTLNGADRGSYVVSGTYSAPASATFSTPSVTVPVGGSASFSVTIAANAGQVDRGIYGGYVVLTPQGGGQVYRVPYAGLKGDYQSTRVLTPTVNGFPWLAQLVGNSYVNRAAGGSFSMQNGDIPFFLLHLDHLSRKVLLEAKDAKTGRSWHRVSLDEYVTRNSTPGGFFAFAWDGTTFSGKGRNASQWYTAPNGTYTVTVSVLKALGDENNPAHWETWTSPVITIARP